MKRRGLVATFEQDGCVLLRHGAKHDIYHQPKSGRSEHWPTDETAVLLALP